MELRAGDLIYIEQNSYISIPNKFYYQLLDSDITPLGVYIRGFYVGLLGPTAMKIRKATAVEKLLYAQDNRSN